MPLWIAPAAAISSAAIPPAWASVGAVNGQWKSHMMTGVRTAAVTPTEVY
jgi:hypothetical protein